MNNASFDDQLLSPRQVAERYGYQPQSLANLRSRGAGPRFLKLPGGRVRYRSSDLLAWELSAYDEPAAAVAA